MSRVLYTAILLTCFLCMSVDTFSQRVSHTYKNVSLSKALLELNNDQKEYVINFLYNELEDFRITTTVSRKSLPDAIRQMIGFYPVSMTVKPEDHEIYVECTHKTDRHLTGTVIDEQGLPVVYAKIAVLNPADSALLSCGVSNESGYFAIPYELSIVLVRISHIGYKTVYRLCHRSTMGTIQVKPEILELKGATVKGQRPLYTSTDRGLKVTVQGTLLEQFGSVGEMLTHLPLMMSDGTIAGHGKPEIYINNKKVRNVEELDRLRADEILSAELITNPGAEYGAEVTSVIRLKTVRKAGEGWSGNFSTAYRQGKECYTNGNASLNYRTSNGMDFFARGYLTNQKTRIDATANDQLQASSVWDYQKEARWLFKYKYFFADLGWNWDINDNHAVGMTYTAFNYLGSGATRREMDDQVWQDGRLADGGHSQTNTKSLPHMTHAVNAYYVGNVGKWNLDFSADFYDAKSVQKMDGGTENTTYVSSRTDTRNQLLAEKLVVTAPVPKGELTFGEEVSMVDRTNDFTQSGFSSDSHIRQNTSIWSVFANYAMRLGKFSLHAGLRWQDEHNLYKIDGKRNDEMSPDYSVLIPRISMSYQTEKWNHKLAIDCSRQNPSYGLLSSSVNYRSKYEYDMGNPFLKPQTSYLLSWATQWKWVYVEAYYKYNKNSSRSFQYAYDDQNHPGVMVMTYLNSPKRQFYGIDLNFSPKIGFWQMNYSASLYFVDEDLKAIGITHKWNGLCTDFTLDNTFTLPHSWMLNCQCSLTPYQESACAQVKTTGFVNLRLSKQLLKDKSLSIAILANDILHTQYTEMTAYSGINIRTQFRQYNDSRRFGIDLAWRFNATRSRYKGSHAGQSERNRL